MKGRLRIRQWMIIGMLIVLLLPRLLFEVSDLLDRSIFASHLHARQQSGLTSAIHAVSEADARRWEEPQWQDSLQNIAELSGFGIILLDAAGREIMHAGPTGAGDNATRQLSIIEQGEMRGQALFFVPDRKSVV